MVDCTGKHYFNKVNKKNGKYCKRKVDVSPFCVFKSVGQSVSVTRAFKTQVLQRTL